MGLTSFEKACISLLTIVASVAIIALVYVLWHHYGRDDMHEGLSDADLQAAIDDYLRNNPRVIQNLIENVIVEGETITNIIGTTETVCEMLTGLPEATNPDEYLLPAVEGGNCVRKTTPHFPSLTKTCIYAGPESEWSLIDEADQGFTAASSIYWVITELTVDTLGTFVPPNVTSPTYTLGTITCDLDSSLNPRGVAHEFISFLNTTFGTFNLATDQIRFSAAIGDPDFADASFSITTRFGMIWSLTVQLWVEGSHFGTYSYTEQAMGYGADTNPVVWDGGHQVYWGGCTVLDVNVASVAPDRALRIPCGPQFRNPTKGLAPTPMVSDQPLTDWKDANPLLKERIETIKMAIAEEYKLEDPSELQLWLFGSQVKGRSRSGSPDIDLEVYHPKLSNTDPEKEKILTRFEFAVDLYFRKGLPEQPQKDHLRIQ